MKTVLSILIVALAVNFSLCEVFFQEKFTPGWETKWVSAKKRDGLGKWVAKEGGLKTSQDAKFYAISAKFDKSFSNSKNPIIIQYSVKHPQGIDCGGGYVKLLPTSDGFSQDEFKGESQYNVMFGPDICGGTKKVHLIFNYKGKNLDWKKVPTAKSDKITHIYTVIINSDATFEYLLDGVSAEKGSLKEGWPFLLPKEIPDAKAKKPEDWVDSEMMLDVNDKKPEDWDAELKTLADPKAKKPDGWDDEEDGKWQAPQVPNPKWKGEWKQRMIKNPKFKGHWTPPNIPNPDYKDDDSVGIYSDFSYIGLDLWQVKSGTVFGNILITDDESVAAAERKPILEQIEIEKKESDKQQAEEQAKRKKQEEERKAKEEERKAQEEANKKQEEAKKATEEKKKEEELTKLAKEKAEQLKKDIKSEESQDAKDEL